VGRHITFSDLKVRLRIRRRMFGQRARVRFRASYFPFTEPSAEMDVECLSAAEGLRSLQGIWLLEILGSGMVHPVCFRMAATTHGATLDSLSAWEPNGRSCCDIALRTFDTFGETTYVSSSSSRRAV